LGFCVQVGPTQTFEVRAVQLATKTARENSRAVFVDAFGCRIKSS
jgi:hypothetical protein